VEEEAMVSRELLDAYERQGYAIAKGLFSAEEVSRLRAHYMALRPAEEFTGNTIGLPEKDPGSGDAVDRPDDKPDPLLKYPRMIQLHRWDEVSLQWMLDERLDEHLTALLGESPFAVQTMLYFKPPGARGQALHQDQYYLKVQPGTCMAAWLALDDCDEDNGCMQVVNGSHTWDVLCTIKADTTTSFTDVTVPLPEGVTPTPAIMKAGDVLFFNGSLVHGSFPNRTTDRFRRALIGHYIVGEAQKVGEFYHPVLRMDGTEVEIGFSEDATKCGIWVDEHGNRMIELVDKQGAAAPGHE
jgi:phytanoyl-CoA hydroxylase